MTLGENMDQIALEQFGIKYDQLSAFSQLEVRRAFANSQGGVTMDTVDVVRALKVAQFRLAELEKNNKDLWEENEDLQLQLLEAEDATGNNRSARKRQDSTS